MRPQHIHDTLDDTVLKYPYYAARLIWINSNLVSRRTVGREQDLSVYLPFTPFLSGYGSPLSLSLPLCWHIYISHSRISMTVTVTNLSFQKKKEWKKEGGKSALFYSGGAQPENSILRQQWRGKYLSKDQRWQSETHYKTMADCLPAWLLVRSCGAAMSCHAVICQEREKETEAHIIISLLIAVNTGVNDWSQRV